MSQRFWSRVTPPIWAGCLMLALLAGLPASGMLSEDGHTSVGHVKKSGVEEDLNTVRKATARYNDIKVALADGYHAPNPYLCYTSDKGTMGYHYLKPDLLDDTFNIKTPELLIYLPNRKGEMDLVAVEYMKPDDDQNLETDNDRPSLFNQPFDGPMLGHEEGMPIHYDLHVWIWEENPNGTFAQWNPAISCPKGAETN